MSKDREPPSLPLCLRRSLLADDLFSHQSCLFATCPLPTGINSAGALHRTLRLRQDVTSNEKGAERERETGKKKKKSLKLLLVRIVLKATRREADGENTDGERDLEMLTECVFS